MESKPCKMFQPKILVILLGLNILCIVHIESAIPVPKTSIRIYTDNPDAVGEPKTYNKIGSKYYYVEHKESTNWFGAVSKCRQMDANLINLQSYTELILFDSLLGKSSMYWTDLNNLVDQNLFYSLTTGTETNLLNEKRDNSHSNSVLMCGILQLDSHAKHFTLSQRSCNNTHASFICETRHPKTMSVIIL